MEEDKPESNDEEVVHSPEVSDLVGKVGIQDEVFANLARAEAEMNDPDANPTSGDDEAAL